MSPPGGARPRGPGRGRVLVTGAAGFLGYHVLAALLDAGWDVLALVHRRPLPESIPAGPLHVIPGDVDDPATARRVVGLADGVVHLAAFVPPDQEDLGFAEPCLKTNALATLHLARAAAARAGRFVYASAGNAYAPPAGQGQATEASPLYPARRATCYLASKLLGEVYVEHLRRVEGLPAVSLRISTPYGPGMPARAVAARFLTRARHGLPLQVWDGGRARYDFVYVADVAGAIVAALGGGAPGVYNVGAGTSHSVLELARAVAATFPEHDVPIEVLPAGPAAPAHFPALVCTAAAAAWGYRPRPLRHGLLEYRRQTEGDRGESGHLQ